MKPDADSRSPASDPPASGPTASGRASLFDVRGDYELLRHQMNELIESARALSQERDITALLDKILAKSRSISYADAGSIYVLEGNDPDPTKRMLRFKLSQNDSCMFASKEFVVPVSMRSIAGAAVLTRAPINILDVYDLAPSAPYAFDRSFDERVGYRTCSMLTVPLISAEEEVIGVIQLINRKRHPDARLHCEQDFANEVTPFDARAEALVSTLAAQAGIALENALLYDEINRIFDGFVRASVQAIEQRDPTTSGHSLRVSQFSMGLAALVDRETSGKYGGAAFTPRDMKELEYAALLHDFGKIGVREEVLVKAKKLKPASFELIRSRFDYATKHAEAEVLERKLMLVQAGAGASELRALDEELDARRAELSTAWSLIESANEPTVLREGDFTRIAHVGALSYVDGNGLERTLLTPDEVLSLQVQRGSLNADELEEIRAHVKHTYDFLVRIPWGKSLTRVPVIAGAHHERLNGKGYPNGWAEDAIPLPSKIMSVVDIYDALTANDRPYKKAVPRDRAFDILREEAKAGHVDGELLRLFIEGRAYEIST